MPKAFDDCVKAVKRKAKKGDNPFAICNAMLKKKRKGKR